jgi:GLPGLI family protein
MKFTLFIISIFVFFTLSFKTTSFSGEISYAYQRNHISKEQKQKNKELYGLLDQFDSSAKELTFQLKFNSSKSFYSIKEMMENDLNPMAVSYANNLVSKGRCYYDKENGSLLTETNVYGDNTLIKSNSKSFEWKLLKESKKIGNYTCFKATTLVDVQSRTKNKAFLIEAWYCPELALPYGPNGYNGLPGIILELRDVKYTFYAKSIKIEKENEYTIKPLVSNNIITEEEHNQNMLDKYGN